MNNLVTFQYQDSIIRTQQTDKGEPLFCLADVCKVLDGNQPNKVAETLREEFELPELNSASFDTGFGIKEFTMITEPQLYFVLYRSRSELAKPFRRWIDSEVLPSIRKTGQYSVKPVKLSLSENLEAISIVLRAAHIEGNQLALSLDKAYKAKTGESALALSGTILVADTQTQLYTPTQLGKEIGISAVKFNLALQFLDYQTKVDKQWNLTPLGQAKGGTYLDTNKKHSDGTPVRQLKWPYEVINDVKRVLEEIDS